MRRQTIPLVVISAIVLFQLLTGLWHIKDPFIDGRYHYNWNPPFWLINAEATNRVGIAHSFFGVVSGVADTPGVGAEATAYYESHPQLIGPLFALWTRVMGYSEWSPRLLSLLLIAGTTLIFFTALRVIFGWRFATGFAAIFVQLPLIFVYGKMLNHEPLVLFFIAVSFWGFVKVIRVAPYGLPLLITGILGMALSDWSGFVFGGLFMLIMLAPPLGRARAIRRAALWICATLLLGLAIFFIQSYLQKASLGVAAPDLGAFMARYMDLWRYRSGQETTIPWHIWLGKELIFVNRNYSLILWIAGMAGLGGALIKKSKLAMSPERMAAVWFFIAIVVGQMFYLVSLKQATFIHLYYQYFFSLPVAFGTVLLLDRIAGSVRSVQNRHRVLLAAAAAITLASGLYSVHVYTRLLTKEMWGDRSDIALVRSLRDLPKDARIIVADNQTALDWFANPNIIYYAGRAPERFTLAEVPHAPYQIVPASMAPALTKLLISGKAYGVAMPTDTLGCSTHFCLLHLHE
ncbi:MAG: hypothetical protein A3J58_01005 [Candidatus Sungbacteria bacterium RIFCSPHIGHO2_02_FULL_52_23]|uniref:Uncharacterized protein n=1 Tax=Candidatus Sungbacteria bacterium RIFCSPHIGHO2_02_FULL_52_23 TaxID=1802274 RepID=A0A1G2KW29_9BACT|nr:MAG: hypothetical protein A3J58_01005 [Candidatus Sungbacteria bacterium RIFCSPHIGHO2_02_FULL_52_23]